jgi:hypothetical protein
MRKAILFAVVAFALSLGGTTALLVRLAPPPRVAAAEAAKDSSSTAKPAAAGKPADSAGHAAPGSGKVRPDSTARADSVTRPVTGPTGQQAAATTPSAGPKPAVRPPVDPTAKAAAVKQVARVLSAMKAAEAAKVLGFLSDEEVEGILRAVGPRQAADFMTNLPKERAAALSRRLMAPRAQEQSR